MAEESAKLRIPYIAAAQAQKHVTHNEGVTLLDTLVQLSVLDKDLVDPPGSPTEGDTYIVAGAGGTATGAWAGWEKRVARHIDGEWRSYLPGQGNGAGWLAWVLDEDTMYRFDGVDWDAAGIEGPQGAPGPDGADGTDGAAGADGADGQSFQPDAAVALIAGRDAYDDEAAAFSVLVVSDSTNDDLGTLYFKLSATSADWSDSVTFELAPGGSVERIGIAFPFRGATPPDGAFAEDGSVITVATYPEFVAVTYCGDGENATADYHYRCTDAGDPTNTRSISGDFFVLCDSRGENIRGWDNGRGIDAGRSLWEMQTDGAPNLTGTMSNVLRGGTATVSNGVFSWSDIGGVVASGSTKGRGSLVFDASDSSAKYGAANEVRGRGSAALACIWYQN